MSDKPRQRLADPLKLDRLPPHSVEAEQGVLGRIFDNPNDAMAQCVSGLSAGSDVFYDLRHRAIYDAFLAIYEARTGLDVITVMQWLKDRQQLEAVGGLVYLSSLPDLAGGPLEYYLPILIDKFLLRQMIATCTEAVGRVYEHAGEAAELIDAFERDALQLSKHLGHKADWGIKTSVHECIDEIEKMHQSHGALTGLPTGFVDFDRMTGGLQSGDMIVLAGRPSMGKSSLAFNIAENLAIEQRVPVGIFSLEMTKRSSVMRLLCSRARVNLRNIREGFLAERDFGRLTGSAGKLNAAPLYIDDTSGLSVLQLRSRARQMVQLFGIRCFVIDYLQLLISGLMNNRQENRQREISYISQSVKALAKELNVPIIILSQLNRDMEKEKNRKPRLSDLRESGSIEQDADLVGMLYRPARDNEDDNDAIPVNLLVAKQRNGPTGDVNLTFLKSFTRFESAARISSDDVPEESGQRQFYPD